MSCDRNSAYRHFQLGEFFDQLLPAGKFGCWSELSLKSRGLFAKLIVKSLVLLRQVHHAGQFARIAYFEQPRVVMTQ